MQNDTFRSDEPRRQMQAGVDAVKEAASQATDFVRRQADRRSRELGGRLSAAADDLESTLDDVTRGGQEIATIIARQLAQVARRAGHYLEHTDTRRMLKDARRFAREQPWTVVAIGMVAGFALSRVVKHAFPSDSNGHA